MPQPGTKVHRMYLRVSAEQLSFAVYHPFGGCPPVVENYDVNPTASLNVNLRKALAVTPLAQEQYANVDVLLNVPYTLVPLERFDEENISDIYRFNFHDAGRDRMFYDVAGSLDAVFVYGMDDAFCRVVDEAFPAAHFRSVISSVANRFAEEARGARFNRLYVYRHESVVDIFAFRAGHLQLGNRYVTHGVEDAAYYVMLAADTLAFDVRHDEFVVIDEQRDSAPLALRLRDFAGEVRELDAEASFGRHALSAAAEMPYDLKAYLMQPY